MRLILTRHGQTDWNKNQRVQGKMEMPLNERGIWQAQAFAKRVAHSSFSACYVSPQSRARETASFVQNAGKVYVDERLREIDLGVWESMGYMAIQEQYPEIWKVWSATPADCSIPGAEDLKETYLRVVRFIEDIANKHEQEETLLVVTHTMPAKLIVAHYLKLALNEVHKLKIDNCSYSEIHLLSATDGKLITLNECSFLQEGGRQ